MSVVIPSMEVVAAVGKPVECGGGGGVFQRRQPGEESFWRHDNEDDDSSESSSSIGAPGESSVSSSSDEVTGCAGDDEAESKPKKEFSFGSLDALEDSLPIKRGLSNFFSGKSKSFACLTEVANSSAKDLVKTENPFNKRRRILMAAKNSWRSASYASLNTSSALPPLVDDDAEEEDDEEEDHKHGGEDGDYNINIKFPLVPFSGNNDVNEGSKTRRRAFKSPRSFSLSDLQHAKFPATEEN